ncbi:hypothetical protein [Streptomyces sp. NPDC050759]|uniref:hypothetical protein n=1 Tax=Streptomyces sp. NPDC050759 TaxID=3365635 RepID=UPI0037AC27E8
MAQRIAAAVALSAISGSYLHGTSGSTGGPRTAFAHATLLCAALLTAAAVLSLLRPRLTARQPVLSYPDQDTRAPLTDYDGGR